MESFEKLSETFLGLLTLDVIIAQRRRAEADTQSSRRDLLRTTFAAIEGYIWHCRETVHGAAKAIDDLPLILELALLEKSFSVTDEGKVIEQSRFHTFATRIRLIVDVATRICPDLKVEFGGVGWSSLKNAIKARDRITHPKKISDLHLSDQDMNEADKGLRWTLETVAHVVESAAVSATDFHERLESFWKLLQNGDPLALAAYEGQLLKPDDDHSTPQL